MQEQSVGLRGDLAARTAPWAVSLCPVPVPTPGTVVSVDIWDRG